MAIAVLCSVRLTLLLYIVSPGFTKEITSIETCPRCVCPGNEATFQCVLTGGTATIWQGTALDECENENVILRHSQFDSGLVLNKTCGITGLVVGKAISGGNHSNTYTSQLIISNYSKELYGSTIECTSDSDLVSNNSQIILSEESFGQSPNIKLMNIYNGQVTFVLSSLYRDDNYQNMSYIINSTDCGVCPDMVTSNTFKCDVLNISKTQLCVLKVQPVACDNVYGQFSEPVALSIEGAPNQTLITEFDDESNIKRIFLEIRIIEIPSSNVSVYTVAYIITNSSVSCRSVTIPISSCENGTCSDIFEVSSSNCSLATQIRVYITLMSEIENKQVVTAETTEFQTSMQPNINPSVLLTAVVSCIFLGILIFTGLIVFILIVILIKVYHNVHSPHLKGQNVRAIEASATVTVNRTERSSTVSEANVIIEGTYSLAKSHPDENSVGSKNNGDHSQVELISSKSTDSPSVIYENKFHNIDKSLNLDSLLIQIRSQVTPKWYQFGVAVGISKETLDELSNFPAEGSVVEMLDLWLRRRDTAATWRDVAEVLKQIGLYLLAEKILKIYKTGKLPTIVDTCIDQQKSPMICNSTEHKGNPFVSTDLGNMNEDDSGAVCPPLPPKPYQCTSELL